VALTSKHKKTAKGHSLENTQIPDIFFTPHFMHKLLTFSRNYLVKVDDVIKGHEIITHAQTIVGYGVIIASPHELAHPSH
jgi:hypothetical protein